MAQQKGTRVRNLSDALVEDACPVCSVLKDFQACYLTELDRLEVDCLCGFHVWMVAKTTEAGTAARIFLRQMEGAAQDESVKNTCGFCTRISEEERARLKEFAEDLNRPEFRQWLRQRGELCLPHARKLLDMVPKRLHDEILTAVRKHGSELRRKLSDLLRDRAADLPIRGGVLGRVAEYLVAQRGLSVRP